MTDIVSECTDLYQKPAIVSKWTDELTAKIKLLWETKSATEISALLLKQDGVTVSRNAVIGKLHRLRLKLKDKHVIHERTRTNTGYGEAKENRTAVNLNSVNAARNRAPARFRTAPQPFIVASHADASPQHIAFADLTKLTCKWPFGSGSPSEFTFCGDNPVKDMPYCPAHCRVSYVEPGRRTGRGIAA